MNNIIFLKTFLFVLTLFASLATLVMFLVAKPYFGSPKLGDSSAHRKGTT